MAFRVEIAPRAFEDLNAIAEYVRKYGSLESANRWFNGIIASIGTLSDLPSRCPLAEESEDLEVEVHLLLYGRRNRSYKIYFAIHGKAVRVFHVRHWAREPLATYELQRLMGPGEEPE